MSEAIVVALITGGLSLIGVVITCMATAKKNETAMKVSQAVTDTKIDELTREVRKHNNFAQRMRYRLPAGPQLRSISVHHTVCYS